MLADRMRFVAAEAEFRVLSADFDGTNDFLTRGAAFTGAANGAKGIFSAFVRFDGGDGAVRTLLYAATYTQFWISSGNILNFYLHNGAASNLLEFRSTSTLTAGASWRHLLASWDVGTRAAQFYLDDVDDANLITSSATDVAYTYSNWAIGADLSGSSKFNGCMAEYYLNTVETLDFSVEANRRKFISANGKPVNVGTDGSLPTGTAPIVYLSLRPADAASAFATNRGTGGNFSITGSLDIGSTSPSN